jgi:NurA-like 5'-3' nuclease
MSHVKHARNDNPDSKRHTAMSVESKEQYLIGLAYDLVEERLRNGTATSQETTHFLKLGSTRERIEREMLENQKEVLKAKAEAIQSQKRIEELYAQALSAFKEYGGGE